MNTIIATIKRPNGTIETVDLGSKFLLMNDIIFRKIKESTAKAGRGELLKIECSGLASNVAELEKEYRREMLEGGEGYIPDMTKSPKYREWQVTQIFD